MNKKLTKQELMAIQPFLRQAKDILGRMPWVGPNKDPIIAELDDIEDKLWLLENKVKKALTTAEK